MIANLLSTTNNPTTPRQSVCRLKAEKARRALQRSFRAFFHAYRPTPRYCYGRHTWALIDELARTTAALEAGRSRYLCVCMPFRHGKSDIASRRYPVWHLLRNPDHELIVASYNHQLATEMSFEARRCFQRAGRIYGLDVESGRASVDAWRVAGRRGALYAAGLGGTITGRGAHVLIIDDYLKNREEAESPLIRDKLWDSFTCDLMTRLAPVHAVVIVANRWHIDDLVGRIRRRNDPDSEAYDADFPRFEHVTFPACDADGRWLFPERFGESWYRQLRASLGRYAWNAQAQQDPQPRSGNLLRVDRVQIAAAPPDGLAWRWGWDIAATEKQRVKDDPDYTVGVKSALDGGRLYIAEVVRGRWGTLRRNEVIRQIALRDGPSTPHTIEAVGVGVDTFRTLRAELRPHGISVRKFIPTGDKVARASALEPLFELGHVIITRASWNAPYLDELAAFPAGRHDDQVDATLISAYEALHAPAGLRVSR